MIDIFSIFRRRKPRAKPGNADDFWYTDAATSFRWPAYLGSVTTDEAMRVAAVYACVRVISETAAMLPLILYRRLPNNRGKERAFDHPLYPVLHTQPNRWQTTFQFVEQLTAYALLRGRGVARRVVQPGGRVELWPIHPDLLTVERNESGVTMYRVKDPQTGEEFPFTQNEVLDLHGLSWDGVTPMTPLTYARNTISLARAAESFGSRFFDGDGTPRISLTFPQTLTKDGYDRIKRMWQETYGNDAGWHKAAILEQGGSVEKIGMTQEDAQFIETRQFQAKEIARIFRVPPHKIGIMDDATFSNIEQQSMEFVTDTMLPWLRRWETALQRDVIPDDDLFAEFLLESLLRGDTNARYDAYSKAINDGWMTRNEARMRENMNPEDGLDEFLESQNTRPANGEEPGGQSPPPMDEPDEGEDEDDEQASEMDELIRYVADRIATREIRTIGTRARLADDDRAKFMAWAAEWFNGHADWILSHAPLCLRVTEMTAASIAQAGYSDLHGGDPVAVVDKWITSRAAEIAAAIVRGMGNAE